MQSSIEEPPPAWAKKDALENYGLTLGKGSADEEDEDEPGSQRYRVAAAAKTTKLEIIELVDPTCTCWIITYVTF